MKFYSFTFITLCTFILSFASGIAQKLNDTYSFQRQIHSTYFVENKGQWDKAVQFAARYPNMNAWVTSSGFVFDVYTSVPQDQPTTSVNTSLLSNPSKSNNKGIRGQVINMEFTDGKIVKPIGDKLHAGVNHYILGNNPAQWIRDVQHYEAILVNNLYNNVDMRVYSSGNQFRYDLVCKPNAKANEIHFRFSGAENVELSPKGDLILGTSVGDVLVGVPVAYQIIDDKRINVDCKYQINANGAVGFVLGTYNINRDLIIDPPVYSRLQGGNDAETGFAIAVDTNKSAYITGETGSSNFPVTDGAYKTSSQIKTCYVSKFTPSGTGLAYSTYLGGDTSGLSHGQGIFADASGAVYITGYTTAKDFPTTDGSKHHNLDAGFDAFVTKLNSAGSGLVYSTLIGGRNADYSNSLAVNTSGEVFFAGYTEPFAQKNDYPVTPNAYSKTFNGGSDDGFVTKLDTSGKIVYSTLIGGNGDDYIRGITVDINGSAYITGETTSPGETFPTTPFVIMKSHKGLFDCFVSKFSPKGDSLIYSTLLGDIGDDRGAGIAVDFTGNAFVTGYTNSPRFQITASPLAFDTLFNGGAADGFIMKLNSTGGRLEYSTFLGGDKDDYCSGIAIDACGAAYVTGFTNSTNFPTTRNGIDSVHNGQGYDCFITKANSSGSVITYSTFVGGALDDIASAIFVDSTGAAYITGNTESTDYPTTAGAGFAGNQDAFVTKIQVGILPLSPRIISNGPLSFCTGGFVVLEAEDKFYKTYQWSINDSVITGAISPVVNAKDSGVYRLDVTDASGCIGTGSIHVKVRPVPFLDAGSDILMCPDSTAQFKIMVKDSIRSYKWVPNLGLSSDTIANPSAKPPVSVTYFVTITDTNGCSNYDSVHIIVLTPDMITLSSQADTAIICPDDSLLTRITVHNMASVPQKLRITNSMTEFRIVSDSSVISAQDSSVFFIQFIGSPIDSVYSGEFTILDQCNNPHVVTLNVRVGKPLITHTPPQDITICQFDTTTKYLTIHNTSNIPAILDITGGGGKFTLTQTSAGIASGDSAVVGVFFAGDVANTYATKIYWTDQCGRKDSAATRIIVEAIPLTVILTSPANNAESIGVERLVDISVDSLNVINQSTDKEITLTVHHEQTSVVFESVAAPQCQVTEQKFSDKTIIKLLNCSPNLQNPIATLRYSTVVGSTLTPTVYLTDVTLGDRCITPTVTGADTLRLLAYGCEIKTLNVRFFTSALRSNFPNPSSTATTIEYATVEEVPVKIMLVNTLGQTVRTIMDIPHKPGVYQTTFPVNDISEGLYFLVMEAGAYRDAKSVVISQEGR